MSEAVQKVLHEYSFKLSNLLEYLEVTGWEMNDHPNPNILLFSYSINEQIVKVVIPKDKQIIDYNERIMDAIKIISSIEDRDALAVINSIIKLC